MSPDEVAWTVLNNHTEHRMSRPVPPKSSLHEYLLNGTWHATNYGFAMMAEMWAGRTGKSWQNDIEAHVANLADVARADSMLHEKADQIFVLESKIRQQQRIIALFLKRCANSTMFTALEMMELPRDSEIEFASGHTDTGGLTLAMRKPVDSHD